MTDEIGFLERQLAESLTLPARIDVMNALAWKLRRQDWARAQQLAEEAYALSQEGDFITTPYWKGVADSLTNLGGINERLGEYRQAFSQSTRAYAMYKELDDLYGQAKALGNMGFACARMGNLDEGLAYKTQQMEIARQLGDKGLEADALSGLAMIHGESDRLERSLGYVQQALDIYRETGNKGGEAAMLNNCAAVSVYMGKFEEAVVYANECVQLCQVTHNEMMEVGALDNMAHAYLNLTQYEEAMTTYHLNLEKVRHMGHKELLAETFFGIGEVHKGKKEMDSAILYYYQALDMAEQLGARRKQHVYHEALADTYKARGDYGMALAHYEQFRDIERSVFSEDMERKFKVLEETHRAEVAEKEAAIYRKRKEELEQEIARRLQVEAALRRAKEQAEQARKTAEIANHAKSEFLSNMSHELRTPLNGILGYTQILRQHHNLTRQQQEGVDIIHQSGEHLLMLINDILDISKIEARKLELFPGELFLPHFLEGVVGLMQMRTRQKGLQFICELAPSLPEVVLADEKRLRQILINLLGNAIKFTQTGFVQLRVTMPKITERGMAHICFEVIDSGVGIFPEHLDVIFQPFEQVGAGYKQAEGTGLGLAISSQLVEAMGGTLNVESEVGQGSRFWFTLGLPLTEMVMSETALEMAIVGYVGRPRHILVVDDKAHNRSVLVEMLTPLGFLMATAENGEEAVQIAHTIVPDIIIMDLVMPVMDGLEAARILRGTPGLRHIPLIMVSASVLETEKRQSLQAGYDAFLPKPVRQSKLLATLAELLSLEWVYASSQLDSMAMPVTVFPSRKQVEEIEHLMFEGDFLTIKRIAQEMEQDTTLYPFAQQLYGYAAEFDEDKLMALLNRCNQNEHVGKRT